MDTPGPFYGPQDLPDRSTTERMWEAVQRSLPPARKEPFLRIERRSFLYGVAASFLLIFTGIGIHTTVSGLFETARPAEVRAEEAYRTAIGEFERIVQHSTTAEKTVPTGGLRSVQLERLRALDTAIGELRQETGTNDLSPLKRLRLYELYQMKLELLQEMVQRKEQRL